MATSFSKACPASPRRSPSIHGRVHPRQILAPAIHAGYAARDVIGTQIYNPQSGGFSTRKGPVFANLVLATNQPRAAKVQSALLEAMQEKQVTIGDQTYKLDEPFLVLATQNPLSRKALIRCRKRRLTASC